jgi:hemerythrin-like domain-containing protein
MSDVIAQLREEHRNIAKVLGALEHQLAIFDKGEQPDYDVLAAIADYFVGFPDRCHHPKEDLVYAKMRGRDAILAGAMTALDAEHDKIATLARRFQEAVRNVMQEVEVSRSAFDEVARHFLEEQRHHMRMEEEHFFPLALQVLTADDWKEIETAISEEQDPVFRAETSKNFAALRDNIFKWESEDEVMEESFQSDDDRSA